MSMSQFYNDDLMISMSMQFQERREVSQIEVHVVRTIKEVFANTELHIVNEIESEFEFSLNENFEEYRDLTLNFMLSFENERLTVTLKCNLLPSIQRVININGRIKLLEEINRFNLEDQNGLKIFWESDCKLLTMIKGVGIPNKVRITHEFISTIFHGMRTAMKEFLKIIMRQKQTNSEQVSSKKKHLQKQTLIQLEKIRKEIEVQITKRSCKAKNKNEKMRLEVQKLIENNLGKKEDGNILRTIKILDMNIKQEKNLVERAHTLISEYITSYQIYTQSSLNNQTAQFLQGIQQKQKEIIKTQNESSLVEGPLQKKEFQKNIIVLDSPLIAKKTKIENNLDFDNEKEVLKEFKDLKCKNIASYFSDREKNWKKTDVFYIQKEPHTFSQKNQINTLNRLNLLKGLVFAVIFINENNFIHRDLKPSNTTFSNSLETKLIDFGSAVEITQKSFNSELPLRTTKEYNLFYENLCQEIKDQIKQYEFEHHPLFDVYAIGKMIEVFLMESTSSECLGLQLYDHFQFVKQKCCEMNPRDRPSLIYVYKYLQAISESFGKKKRL